MPNPSQPFRLGSDGQVHHLEVFEESQTKHQVVFWDDITRVFPKVLHVKNGHTIVSLARNQQHQWCEPRCIRYYPGVTLEVIEGDCPDTQATPIPTNTLAIAPRSSASFESTDPLQTVESLVILDAATVISPFIATTLSSSANETLFATPTTPPHRLLQRTQSVLQESSAQMVRYERSVKAGQLVQADSIMYGMQAMLKNIQGEFRALHSEVAKNDELRALTQKIQDLEAAAKAQAKRMEEMHKQSVELQERSLKMQQEALDRLAQIQSKVAAILTQNYELHEYPIPRLFIVLPKEDITRTEMLTRGVRSLLAKQFKLYFLCECGDHTKPADGQPQNCNLKHEIHRALHDGYDIDRPTEFFEKYGSYILTLLQMIKYGVTIAGVVVPPLGQLKVVDSLENVAEGIDHVLKDIGPKVDSSIAYIESLMGTQSQLSSPDSGALSTMEALEGADLRQLESFLKSSDEGRVLGNLYRIVTSEGHVKWVCLDHYRENYRVKAVEDFRDALKEFDGVYIEATGSVQVLLRSPVAARKFYSALSSSRSVQELSIGLLWGYTLQELRELRDTVKSTNLLHLRIQGDHQDSPLSDFLNNGRRSDPILQMMSGGKVQSLQLDNWEGFLDRIGTIPTTLHVRKLEICSKERWFKGASRLVEVLRASPLLTELTCWGDGLGFTMDPVITALENSKLAQGLKLKMGSADYRHTYSDCPGALVQYEPGTSKILSFDLRVSRMEELELVHHPSVQNIYFTIRDGLTALQENLQRRFETTRVQIELGYINGYHLETRRLSHVQDNYIINIQKLSLELRAPVCNSWKPRQHKCDSSN
ncbi:hypothetical protein EC991_004499 [Linnemannia zychae]|nr:hypothetical protein EC991_004499 [Linnemannia zychae]